MSDTRMAAIEAAFKEVGGDEEPDAAPEVEAAPPPAEDTAEPNSPTELEVGESGVGGWRKDAPSAETAAEAAARARDESGRFTKAPKVGKATATPAPQAGEANQTSAKASKPMAPNAIPGQAAAASVPAAKGEKPPPGWSPQAREHWGKLPAEVRDDVWKREREAAVALDTSSKARQFTDAFTKAVSPYERYIRAEGVDALTAVSNTFQAIAVLHDGTPMHKAQIWASIGKTYGIDPDLAAAAWNGTPAPQGAGQPAATVDPRLIAQQVEQRVFQQLEERRGQAIAQKAFGDVEAFGQDKEFFEDLRPIMAAILDGATAAKQAMSLDRAYELARQSHPGIQSVLQQREQRGQVRNAQASTERARLASSSVRSQPATPPASARGFDDRMSAISAAWDEVQSR